MMSTEQSLHRSVKTTLKPPSHKFFKGSLGGNKGDPSHFFACSFAIHQAGQSHFEFPLLTEIRLSISHVSCIDNFKKCQFLSYLTWSVGTISTASSEYLMFASNYQCYGTSKNWLINRARKLENGPLNPVFIILIVIRRPDLLSPISAFRASGYVNCTF